MYKEIYNELEKIEELGLSNINLLALVTTTSYEVVFYATYEGKTYQSNDLAESGIISFDIIDKFYSDIAKIIREDKKFRFNKMNIVKFSNDSLSVDYDEKVCKVYSIKKEWKKSIDE